MSPSDPKVISAAKRGDRDALRELFEAEVPKINAFCNYMVGDKKMAEDILQQTLLQGIEKLDQLEGEMQLTAWLKVIARNIWLKSHRRKKFEGSLSQLEDDDASGAEFDEVPDPNFKCPSEIMVIREAFSKLDEDERTILVLVDIEELEYREAAEVLGISESAVRSRVHRARDQFKKKIKVSEL